MSPRIIPASRVSSSRSVSPSSLLLFFFFSEDGFCRSKRVVCKGERERGEVDVAYFVISTPTYGYIGFVVPDDIASFSLYVLFVNVLRYNVAQCCKWIRATRWFLLEVASSIQDSRYFILRFSFQDRNWIYISCNFFKNVLRLFHDKNTWFEYMNNASLAMFLYSYKSNWMTFVLQISYKMIWMKFCLETKNYLIFSSLILISLISLIFLIRRSGIRQRFP